MTFKISLRQQRWIRASCLLVTGFAILLTREHELLSWLLIAAFLLTLFGAVVAEMQARRKIQIG
jgi:hypothetical protein